MWNSCLNGIDMGIPSQTFNLLGQSTHARCQTAAEWHTHNAPTTCVSAALSSGAVAAKSCVKGTSPQPSSNPVSTNLCV